MEISNSRSIDDYHCVSWVARRVKTRPKDTLTPNPLPEGEGEVNNDNRGGVECNAQHNDGLKPLVVDKWFQSETPKKYQRKN